VPDVPGADKVGEKYAGSTSSCALERGWRSGRGTGQNYVLLEPDRSAAALRSRSGGEKRATVGKFGVGMNPRTKGGVIYCEGSVIFGDSCSPHPRIHTLLTNNWP
jgi:hypothetical protein